MKLLKSLYLLLFAFIANQGISQDVIAYNYLQSMSAAEIEDQFGVAVTFGIDFYKINYTTPDPFMVQDTASGLLVIPQNKNYKYPMLSYSHGTVGNRMEGMSNLQAADVNLAGLYAAYGFAVVAPDYLGMNDSRGFHPYIDAATVASASADMLLAVKDFLPSELGFSLNNKLFLTGYSQGGHACMATQKLLEEEYPNEWEMVASAPMSGPYSVSEKMIEFTLGDTPYGFLAYLPNVALGMLYVDPDLAAKYTMADIFKPQYLADIQAFRDNNLDLFDLNTRLENLLIADVGASIPRHMLHDSMQNFIKNVPSHPISMALAANDVHDWAPTTETRMYYCKGDDQVFWENATFAESKMNANGATNVTAVNLSETANHTGCVSPATQAALGWFFLLRGIVADTDDLAFNELIVSPNPFQRNIIIDGLDANQKSQIILRDLNGKLIYHNTIQSINHKINLDLKSGIYFLEITSGAQRAIRKLIKK